MAKDENPTIYMIRRGDSLQPEMAMDADLVRRIAPGVRVKVKISEGRSPSKLRWYWAFLSRVVNATGCAPSPEVLHDVIKLHTGYVVPVMVKGFAVAVPKSISFAKMSEHEFTDFCEDAVKWIAETYGITPEMAFEEKASA